MLLIRLMVKESIAGTALQVLRTIHS